MEAEERAAWLRLILTPGIGNEAARRLLAAFGMPGEVFAQPEATLAARVGPALAQALREPPAGWVQQCGATAEWLAAAEAGCPRRLLTLADPDYPPALLATADPPLLLWAMGRAAEDLRALPPCIAVVGARNPTPQGAFNADEFSRSLAAAGLAVVSGLALGIDAAAHRGALKGADKTAAATIAVVGTGLDTVYPGKNAALADEIARHGLLLSEYPLGTPALPPNFPRRNRIIAGLSLGTLVVEAALRSGSLITARFAAEQGREVFAIPGSIHSPMARGCHALLRQGAKLVETAQDVLEELQLPRATDFIAGDPDRERCSGLNDSENALLAALGFDPAGIDALVGRTGMGAAQLQAALLELELAGRVARLPGGRFQQQTRG